MPLFYRIHVRSEIHLAELPFLLVMRMQSTFISFISICIDIQLYVYRQLFIV